MADELNFTEGKNYLLSNGLPVTVYFLLSTKPCSGGGAHVAGDTLAGGVGEITGTGYTRQSQAEPTPSAGNAVFTLMTFSTGAAADWPASVKSVVMVISADNSGKALAAWNLLAGGTARDLSHVNTSEQVTPTYTLTG